MSAADRSSLLTRRRHRSVGPVARSLPPVEDAVPSTDGQADKTRKHLGFGHHTGHVEQTSANQTPYPDGEARTDRSLGQLFASATTELSALVHDEIALAKAELRQDVKRAGIGGGAIGGAVVLALFALPVLSFAAAYGIHNLGLGLAWSFLIVGGAYVVLAAFLGLYAIRAFKRVQPPQRSIESTKKTMAALKGVKPHTTEDPLALEHSPQASRS